MANRDYYAEARAAFEEMFGALSAEEQQEWWDEDESAWIDQYIFDVKLREEQDA